MDLSPPPWPGKHYSICGFERPTDVRGDRRRESAPQLLAMAEKKAFLLRLDPVIWDEMERLAQSELRSVNAQIEFLLRDALAQRGIKPREAATAVLLLAAVLIFLLIVVPLPWQPGGLSR